MGFVTELATQTGTYSYNSARGFPFSTWGESLFKACQTCFLVVLYFYYTKTCCRHLVSLPVWSHCVRAVVWTSTHAFFGSTGFFEYSTSFHKPGFSDHDKLPQWSHGPVVIHHGTSATVYSRGTYLHYDARDWGQVHAGYFHPLDRI